MTSPAAIESLLLTVDRMLKLEGLDPALVGDDDKLFIVTQFVCLACETHADSDRVHVVFKDKENA